MAFDPPELLGLRQIIEVDIRILIVQKCTRPDHHLVVGDLHRFGIVFRVAYPQLFIVSAPLVDNVVHQLSQLASDWAWQYICFRLEVSSHQLTCDDIHRNDEPLTLMAKRCR